MKKGNKASWPRVCANFLHDAGTIFRSEIWSPPSGECCYERLDCFSDITKSDDGVPSTLWLQEDAIQKLRRRGWRALARFLASKGSIERHYSPDPPSMDHLIENLKLRQQLEERGCHLRHRLADATWDELVDQLKLKDPNAAPSVDRCTHRAPG